MKKIIIILAVLLCTNTQAQNGRDMACIAIMCLSPAGGGGAACAAPLAAFFDIEKFTGGLVPVFSERLTKIAREKFLKECTAPNISNSINSVINKSGSTRDINIDVNKEFNITNYERND